MIATYYDLDMNEINTNGLLTTNLEVPSIPFVNNWVGGVDGIPPIHAGVDVQQRPVYAHMELISHDYLDYSLLKDYLYGIFGFNKPFYIVDNRQPYKRYRVVLDVNYSPIRNAANNGSVVIPFITTSPYAESLQTTLEGATPVFRGIPPVDVSSLEYTHTTNQFAIYNTDVTIHPFHQDLKIVIEDVYRSFEYFEIKNTTNGSTFRINEAVHNTDKIVIDGATVTSNGLQFLRNTNRQFVELSPGWNEFEVSGAFGHTISFDFRFYYQ